VAEPKAEVVVPEEQKFIVMNNLWRQTESMWRRRA
jgi:hypothetical protein